MTLNLDYSGNDLIVNSISTGAATGQAGTTLTSAALLNNGSGRFVAKAVNFNSATTDTAVAIAIPAGITRYAIGSIWINNASHSLSTATIAVYTSTGGSGGTGVGIALDQAITVTSGTADTNHNAQSVTLTNAATLCFTDATLYVRIGTPESAAATGDVVINLIWLS